MKKNLINNKFFVILLIALISALAVLILYLAGAFSSWQNRLSDKLFVAKAANKNIVIVTIDDNSIQTIGRRPWSRETFAAGVEKINSLNPKVIGIDVSFLETENQFTSYKNEYESLKNKYELAALEYQRNPTTANKQVADDAFDAADSAYNKANDYYDYSDVSNACLSDCTCEDNSCGVPYLVITYNDSVNCAPSSCDECGLFLGLGCDEAECHSLTNCYYDDVLGPFNQCQNIDEFCATYPACNDVSYEECNKKYY